MNSFTAEHSLKQDPNEGEQNQNMQVTKSPGAGGRMGELCIWKVITNENLCIREELDTEGKSTES